ncbi:MAG: hypothetical protein CVV05_01045 [Gammaproteobacteria bacterium HGW-Gammaproteobacteria-1]|jgi:hypothetical protein|nr:MAG: hypothetical protein CVV05_01045 [Gammaproteobacteria bacterium HGW-Gammaproteobacteria-1]
MTVEPSTVSELKKPKSALWSRVQTLDAGDEVPAHDPAERAHRFHGQTEIVTLDQAYYYRMVANLEKADARAHLNVFWNVLTDAVTQAYRGGATDGLAAARSIAYDNAQGQQMNVLFAFQGDVVIEQPGYGALRLPADHGACEVPVAGGQYAFRVLSRGDIQRLAYTLNMQPSDRPAYLHNLKPDLAPEQAPSHPSKKETTSWPTPA